MNRSDRAFLFHTAFCCSTLLARCLGESGKTTALLEPMALVDAAHQQRTSELTADTLELIVRLLQKTPTGDPGILIKPSNLANILALPILDSAASTRAVLLSSSLREFLVSCSKKPDDTRRKMPWLLKTLSEGTPAQRDIAGLDLDRLEYLQFCAMVWHVQQINWDQRAHPGLRHIMMADFLDQPHAVARASAAHLGLATPSDAHLNTVLGHHAKEPVTPYDPAQKRRESSMIERLEGPRLDQTERWYQSLFGDVSTRTRIRRIAALEFES